MGDKEIGGLGWRVIFRFSPAAEVRTDEGGRFQVTSFFFERFYLPLHSDKNEVEGEPLNNCKFYRTLWHNINQLKNGFVRKLSVASITATIKNQLVQLSKSCAK